MMANVEHDTPPQRNETMLHLLNATLDFFAVVNGLVLLAVLAVGLCTLTVPPLRVWLPLVIEVAGLVGLVNLGVAAQREIDRIN